MSRKSFRTYTLSGMAVLAAMSMSTSANAALAYSQDFEGADIITPQSEIGDNFVIGNYNHTTAGGWFAGFAAPNSSTGAVNGYSALVGDQGGAAQGNVQLSVFGDYNPWGPWNNTVDNDVEFFVYRDIGNFDAADAGSTYRFSFDVKQGNIDPNSGAGASAKAYMTVLDGSFATVTTIAFDTTNVGTDWSGGFIDLLVPNDNSWDGYLVQIGMAARGTELTVDGTQYWPATGVYYDNLGFGEVSAVPVPAAVWLFGSGLLGLVGVARRRKAGE